MAGVGVGLDAGQQDELMTDDGLGQDCIILPAEPPHPRFGTRNESSSTGWGEGISSQHEYGEKQARMMRTIACLYVGLSRAKITYLEVSKGDEHQGAWFQFLLLF